MLQLADHQNDSRSATHAGVAVMSQLCLSSTDVRDLKHMRSKARLGNPHLHKLASMTPLYVVVQALEPAPCLSLWILAKLSSECPRRCKKQDAWPVSAVTIFTLNRRKPVQINRRTPSRDFQIVIRANWRRTDTYKSALSRHRRVKQADLQ